jgi:polyhydroxyalkanoate synthesis regulator phasin
LHFRRNQRLRPDDLVCEASGIARGEPVQKKEMSLRKWRPFVIGGAALGGLLALAALLAGPVQAQLGPGDQQGRHDRYLELLAEELDVSVEELKQARQSARNQLIDEAVAAGKLTPEQAEARKDGIAKPAERRGKVGRFALNIFGEAAEILGLSGAEVRAGLKEGKSLADLAGEQGVSNLEEQLATAIEAKLQQAVDKGNLTQAQADRISEGLTERLERIINHDGTPGEKARSEGLRRR